MPKSIIEIDNVGAREREIVKHSVRVKLDIHPGQRIARVVRARRASLARQRQLTAQDVVAANRSTIRPDDYFAVIEPSSE